MKGDISRQTFDPTKHYNQVVMQQGRVQLDADWNEQQAIIQHRVETEARDIIGPGGAPQSGGGFEIKSLPGNRDFLISPGRIYVDGILCELDAGTPVAVSKKQQQDSLVVEHWIVDGRAWDAGQWVELLDSKKRHIRYLQIQSVDEDERTLTFHTCHENPHLTDDECMRISLLRRVITYASQPDYPAPPYTTEKHGWRQLNWQQLNLDKELLQIYLDVWQRHITVFDDPLLREVALNGPDTTTRLQTLWQVKILPIALSDDLQALIAEEVEKSKEVDIEASQAHQTTYEIQGNHNWHELHRLEHEITRLMYRYEDSDAVSNQWEQHIAAPTGTLNVTTYNDHDPASSGYHGCENQLYRVEAQCVNATGNPKLIFKWARNNASTLASTQVDANDPKKVTILSTGQGGILAFHPGMFVDAVNNEAELNGQPTTPPVMIDLVVPEHCQLILHDPLLISDSKLTLRLWDGMGDVECRRAQWIALHDGSGIKIQFSHGTYSSGDYWLIPARTLTREVEWPPYQNPNTDPLPQRRHGRYHHYTELAHVVWHKKGKGSIRDRRRRFSSLTTRPLLGEALHITDISWDNDTIMNQWRNSRKLELEIMLDAQPDRQYAWSMAMNCVIVTLEAHIPGKVDGIYLFDGTCSIQEKCIIWSWDWAHKEGTIARLFKEMDGHSLFSPPGNFIRVRVRVMGHMIWRNVNGRRIYLDGQARGMPGGDCGDGHQRIRLELPTGTGAQASDFESWFYIR